MPRTYATLQQVADQYQVTRRTVRNWIAEGKITGYRLPGGGGIRVDLAECEQAIKPVPTVVPQRRTPYGAAAKSQAQAKSHAQRGAQ